MTPLSGSDPARVLRAALLDAAALVLPVRCAGCGSEGRELCAGCRAQLVPHVTRRRLADGLVVHAGLAYDGVARRAILAFKEEGCTGIARALAPALSAAVAALELVGDLSPSSGPAILCPIPSSRAAVRRRGYDPLAVALRRARLEAVPVFRPAAPRPTQKALDRDDRARNRAGAFRVAARIEGVHIILVDDVVTTGATLVEAARALRAAGAVVVGAVAVASTPLRSLPRTAVPGNRP